MIKSINMRVEVPWVPLVYSDGFKKPVTVLKSQIRNQYAGRN
ncbi:MAG: hypothetical protein WBB70_03890 [Desulfobacterales bacterium]